MLWSYTYSQLVNYRYMLEMQLAEHSRPLGIGARDRANRILDSVITEINRRNERDRPRL